MEKTITVKISLICAGLNLFLSSMMIVGLPVIIKMKLGLSVAITLILGMSPLIVYGIIIAASTVCMVFSTIFTIQALTYLQEETPTHLLGKVVACVMAICMCAQPIGQAIYGGLFEVMKDEPKWIILVGIILSSTLSISSRRVFAGIRRQIKEESKVVTA